MGAATLAAAVWLFAPVPELSTLVLEMPLIVEHLDGTEECRK